MGYRNEKHLSAKARRKTPEKPASRGKKLKNIWNEKKKFTREKDVSRRHNPMARKKGKGARGGEPSEKGSSMLSIEGPAAAALKKTPLPTTQRGRGETAERRNVKKKEKSGGRRMTSWTANVSTNPSQ